MVFAYEDSIAVFAVAQQLNPSGMEWPEQRQLRWGAIQIRIMPSITN